MIATTMFTLEVKMNHEEWADSENCLDILLKDPDYKLDKLLDQAFDDHHASHMRKLLRAMSDGLSGKS